MAQTCGNLLVHLIFSTKQRKPLIRPEIRSNLFAYLGGIVRELGATALIISGTGDHVICSLRTRPAHSMAAIARVVKANSSQWLREKGHKEIRVAGRIRRLQRERIKRCNGHQIHRNARRTPQAALFSGRISGVSETE